jgi:transcriptional regulator with XRE-family HTH domain
MQPTVTYAALVGATLAALRKQTGRTQAELAELTGLGQAAWSKIERGATIPNVEILAIVAPAFGMTPAEVLGRADAVVAHAVAQGVRVLLRRKEEDAEAVQGTLGPRALAALVEAGGPLQI